MASAASKLNVGAGRVDREKHVFVVCTGQHCLKAGSGELLSDLKHECRHTSAEVRVGASRCLGHCQLAPAIMEDGRMMGVVSRRRLQLELSRLGLSSERRNLNRH